MMTVRQKPNSAPAAAETLSGTNLTRAGDYNQRVVLQAVRTSGIATRADLTAITGLTPPTVGNITARLLADGLIRTDGHVTGGRGQPALKFTINPEGAFSLGLNIDRDHVTLVTMDLAGHIRDRASLESRFALPDEVLSFVRSELRRIRRARIIPAVGPADAQPDRLIGIGIGLPDDLGRIPLPRKPAAYDEWSRVDVCELFSRELEMPAYGENDATAAAIGELQFGGGRGRQHFMFTLISAGLGSGIILSGQPYRGASNSAGEIAFIARDLFAASSSNPATADGILQDQVSLYALYDFLGERGIAAASPDELDPNDAACLSAAWEWVDMAVEALIGPFAVMNCAFNPEVHIIGGRLPRFIVERLCERLNARLRQAIPHAPAVAPFIASVAAEDAAPMGAAVLVFQNRLLPRLETLMKTFTDHG